MRSQTLAAVTALALLTLGGCSDDEPKATDPEPTESSSADTPTEDGEPESDDPDDSDTDSPDGEPAEVAVPIYFVADTPQGPKLFREFRRVEDDNPLEEAAALLTAGDALDPDYRTLFPSSGNVASIEYDEEDSLITMQVKDDSWAEPASGMSRSEAKLAVQSLTYTLQGVAKARVRLEVVGEEDGPAVDLFGVPTKGGVTNEPVLDVLGLVNVTRPAQGATVPGSFTAAGVASSFEANVPWEIRQDGEVVESGFATADGWQDRLYPWETEVDVSKLDPGKYEFVAMTDDPSGGEGGGPTEDSKAITIK